MTNDYILIHKDALPEHFQLVLKIKELINKGKKISVACKEVGLSRSTFYKYKDFVFLPSETAGKRIAVSFKLHNGQKSLASILDYLISENCNIVSINQSLPINNIAFVTLIISISNEINPQEFLKNMKFNKEISDLKLISVE